MIRQLGIWIALIGLFALWAYSDQLFPPEKLSSPSAYVKDGDTITLANKTFRINGIDAPEYHQTCTDAKGKDWPCGTAARLQMASMVASGSIDCLPRAIDKYGREVAKCSSATVPDLGEAMVQSGLAISPAERGSAVYGDAEDAARKAKRGIWQGSFEVPADYRATHPRGVAN